MFRSTLSDTKPIQQSDNKKEEEISLESLAFFPEVLINEKGYLKDQNYKNIGEYNCCKYYDRQQSNIDNVPARFKNPLDFFESVTAQYIIQKFDIKSIPKIDILSVGAGKLLRELIILAKFVKILQLMGVSSIPKINLHAIDWIYKPCPESDFWKRSNGYNVPHQFKMLVSKLNLNIDLFTYSSFEEYNNKLLDKSINNPNIILSIDFDHIYEVGFPAHQQKVLYPEMTQEFLLRTARQFSDNGSVCLTLTHVESGGVFIIFESKNKGAWQKDWVHTIQSKSNMNIVPPLMIQNILDGGKDKEETAQNTLKPQCAVVAT